MKESASHESTKLCKGLKNFCMLNDLKKMIKLFLM